jgi:hypothetical protein
MKTKKQINEYYDEVTTQYNEYNNSSEVDWDDKEKLIMAIQLETLEWVLKQTEEGN